MWTWFLLGGLFLLGFDVGLSPEPVVKARQIAARLKGPWAILGAWLGTLLFVFVADVLAFRVLDLVDYTTIYVPGQILAYVGLVLLALCALQIGGFLPISHPLRKESAGLGSASLPASVPLWRWPFIMLETLAFTWRTWWPYVLWIGITMVVCLINLKDVMRGNVDFILWTFLWGLGISVFLQVLGLKVMRQAAQAYTNTWPWNRVYCAMICLEMVAMVVLD